MSLKIICTILAISTIGFGLWAYIATRALGEFASKSVKLTTALATALELYVVNDNPWRGSPQGIPLRNVEEAFANAMTNWKKVPPQFLTLRSAVNRWLGQYTALRKIVPRPKAHF